ncbi:FxsA family protein [Patulibacter sp. SYSU D01012]|uniref:FxsA family protein n=1 Tax=Patulibacter sp. SYSU D01012 TaxID=2817381 RepID=UPI001B31200B|nr:FxsA family protein [Patulibacter sp. SYSU D01012]
MPLLVLALLIVGAVVEVWVALRVSDLIGAAPTVLLLLASALLGGRVLTRGTVRAWRRLQEGARRGERPGAALLDAALVLVAGVLLLLPGLVSGAAGLLLLLPPVRAVLRPAIGGLLLRRVAMPLVLRGRGPAWPGAGRGGAPHGPAGPADIDGTATERRHEQGPRRLDGPSDPFGPDA